MMKTFEVKVWVLTNEFTFKVNAESVSDAIRMVDEKSVNELLSQLKIGDFRSSASAFLAKTVETCDEDDEQFWC